MKFGVTTPCSDCPFRRVGFIALRAGRVREIALAALGPQGATFACHATENEQHCAGALIFAEKQELPTQMMRIAERLGWYDLRKLAGHDEVFGNLRQMLAAHKKAND